MRLLRDAVLGAGFLICATSVAQAEVYMIDTRGAHASINFSVKHLGFSWLTGRFDRFEGSFEFDRNNPGTSSVSVEIDTSSVSTNHEARDVHLKSDDFLDVAKFPRATFKSTGIEVTGDRTAKITGDFTMHGVTRSVVIDASYIGGGKDPWGGFRQGFTGTTSVAMGDYGFKKDLGQVMLTLHAEGIRQ